jgi:hypothetical protein
MSNNSFFKTSIAAKSQNKLPAISKGFQNAYSLHSILVVADLVRLHKISDN